MQKASSLKNSNIISLRTKINELKAELKQAMQKVLLKDSDTIQLCSNPSLEIKAKELENELEKVTQNSSFKDRLIFCLRSRVSNLKCQAERNELEQIPLKSHSSSNDSKTGSDEEEEVSSFFSKNAQGKTPSFSLYCSELEPDERKVKNEVESPIDHTEQKSKEKLNSNYPTISPITMSRSGKALITNSKESMGIVERFNRILQEWAFFIQNSVEMRLLPTEH
ncbi:14747_t:CDS:2, partial [Funneliformis caledonium]